MEEPSRKLILASLRKGISSSSGCLAIDGGDFCTNSESFCRDKSLPLLNRRKHIGLASSCGVLNVSKINKSSSIYDFTEVNRRSRTAVRSDESIIDELSNDSNADSLLSGKETLYTGESSFPVIRRLKKDVTSLFVGCEDHLDLEGSFEKDDADSRSDGKLKKPNVRRSFSDFESIVKDSPTAPLLQNLHRPQKKFFEVENTLLFKVSSPTWSCKSNPASHIWKSHSASNEICHSPKCFCVGSRFRCSCCHMLAHEKCLIHFGNLFALCKSTFYFDSLEKNPLITHHWVYQKRTDGKCSACDKTLSKFTFQKQVFSTVSCSWCKRVFHTRDVCFNRALMTSKCDYGKLHRLILPPERILNSENGFTISATTDSDIGSEPLLVLVNAKSGDCKGSKMIQKFQWYLNSRQVFDLSDGPTMPLTLFSGVENLKILVCGGDGTVGWVLSCLDDLNLQRVPPVAIMPLGTGNDLARALHWGGSYSDDSVDRILQAVDEASVVKLDRWLISVNVTKPNDLIADKQSTVEELPFTLPQSVMNNYFSLGADAQVCLEFHSSREQSYKAR